MLSKTVLSLIGLEPIRIGGIEIWFRELSRQLESHACSSVLCFATEPSTDIRNFLAAPNVTLDVLKGSWELKVQPAMEFCRLMRRYRPNVVHCHFTGFVSPYPWLAKLCSVEKFFFTDHGSRPEGHVRRAAPFWKRVAVSIINHPLSRVQCVSNYGYDCNVAAHLLSRDRYTVIYNGVDVKRALAGPHAADAFRQRYSIPDQRAVVVQISWLIPEKGVQDLLKAARLVLFRNANVQFVIVGDGIFREQFERLAAKLGISEHVTWTGLVHDPLSEGVYAAADVVCQMSRWEEVFGMVVAEAMASERPVIGTRVGGIPELITDGVTGFLVERGDEVVMAERILRLLDDAELRASMGSKARDVVTTKFDHRKNVSKMVELYGLTASSITSGVFNANAEQKSFSSSIHS